MRKKIFTFLLALTASIGMMWAETVVVINKSEFTSSGVTKEGVTLALSNGSMTSSDVVAMDGSFEFSTSLGKFTGITIVTDANIMEIYEGAFTSAGWPTGDNLGTSAGWTGESETVLISCMVAGMNTITITCTIEPTPVIGDSNDATTIETFLSTNNGTEIAELTIDRPVLNNMYNTLCLPFNMDAAQIAASSLNGVEIYELNSVEVVNDELFFGLSDPKNAIVAGRPYIVQYSAASQLDDLDFENVTINNADLTAQAVTMNGVTFKGTFTPFVMGIQSGFDTNGGYLFLGQNNVLYWPNTNNPLKPFRAYFYIDLNSGPNNAPLHYGMPARIGRPASSPTGVENVQGTEINAKKVIRDGQLIIMRNGVEYNANGQAIK